LKVFNYDEHGYFLGVSELNDSDKCKITGDWLIPAMATEKEPLSSKEGFEIKFIENDWKYIKLLTTEEKKIKGELPLEEGEKIVDGALVTIEKPSNYYVWNYTTFEWEYNSEIRKSEIYAELESIDIQTIRPLRAKLTGLATTQDESKLLELETKANTLRNELKTL
jgi:hypothetical protein